MGNTIPHMDYRQYQRIRGLVHQCCNNVDGNCLLLDDGWEPCICVQSISRSLICKYFRAAVLPLDRELETALLYKNKSKRCCQCGMLFRPGSNRGNTVPTAPLLFTVSKSPRANVGAGPSVDN